jgi:YD repeat-containing protein
VAPSPPRRSGTPRARSSASRQADPRIELCFSYDAAGGVTEVVSVQDGEQTVETTVYEADHPVGTVITSDGQEVGRRTITREAGRRTEEETRGGEVVARRVETLDPQDRPVTLEESTVRSDGSVVESRHEQEWLPDGRLAQGTVMGWVTVPGAGRVRTTYGRREMSYDSQGRVSEIILQDTQDDELEDNSYYRFEYGP